MQNTVYKKTLACILALVLALPVFLTGCATEQESVDLDTPALRGATAVASDLREKYASEEQVEYDEGMQLIERDHQFTVTLGFDAMELGFEEFTEICTLFFDPELTDSVHASYQFEDDNRTYTISPPESPDRAAYGGFDEEYPYGSGDDSHRFFDKGANADWGNTRTMYLGTKVDLETGEKLEKPIVQVVTVKGELDTPALSMEVDDDGIVKFIWDEVAGAKAYYIAEFTTDDNRNPDSARLIGYTSDTTWNSEAMVDDLTDQTFSTNKNFKTYSYSEDDWLSPTILEDYEREHGPADGAVIRAGSDDKFFCVYAVNETGTSMYSNFLDIKDIATLAPYGIALNMEKQSGKGFYSYIEGVKEIPSHRWVIMCDGALSQRLVSYDFDAAEVVKETWYTVPDEDEDFEPYSEDVEVIHIPFKVDGTAFNGTLKIQEFDKDNWEEQLEEIRARQEALRNKTGDVKHEVTTETEEEVKQKGDGTEQEIAVDGVAVSANSALSEYLALNMLSSVETVDLTEFPESLDQEYLIDAWSEAFYQNPMVLGVSEAMVSRDGKTLYLAYEDDKETRKSKQAEISERVDEVASEIFTGSMSAREKEYAINQYLCDTVEYDTAALENAEENDFLTVDSEFYDSFTAYGGLIDGVGVCASYAASFKLLADAAGLDCVVVTGYLDGTLGHAWNRVDLGGGMWATVDSTNNDMDIMANALLNAPDSAIANTLVEDTLWLMDTSLAQYSNEDDAEEYYHIEGLFFDKDAVVDELVSQLKTGDTGVVRTDYALTDEQFYEIGNAVLKKTGNDELSGCYWLGIIVITSDYALMS